jgi:hypothetical protein
VVRHLPNIGQNHTILQALVLFDDVRKRNATIFLLQIGLIILTKIKVKFKRNYSKVLVDENRSLSISSIWVEFFHVTFKFLQTTFKDTFC